VGVDGVDEAGDHVGSGHRWSAVAANRNHPVIVEPVEDLDFGAFGQLPGGEIGSPALVGLGGFKPVMGAARAFVGCGVISA
jgi:hypothetical protein